MVSNHIQGLPHPRRLIFEDDRYPDLDDVVEEYEFEGQSLFTRCWQVKRQTDKTPANILKDIIRSLAANDSLRATIATRDQTRVPGIGSLGQLSACIERISSPGFNIIDFERTEWSGERQWIELAVDAVGQSASRTEVVPVLRRLQIEALGTVASIKERSLGKLREAFKNPAAALSRLEELLPTIRDPAVRVTPEMLEEILQEVSSLRADLLGLQDNAGVRELRPKIRQYAQDLLNTKSMMLTRGHRIDPIERLVELYGEAKTEEDTGQSLLQTSSKHGSQLMTLRSAVESSRLLLLFGDLGSGKTTACADLTIQMCENSDAALPVIVPCAAIAKGHFTGAELLCDCSSFLRLEILGDQQKVELSSLLRQGINILLILDSLDEVNREAAGAIARASFAAVRSNPKLSVVATARPSELHLPLLPGWVRATIQSLDRGTRQAFLITLAAARGEDESEAVTRAELINAQIQQNPRLALLGQTPLAVGMLAETASETNDQLTVGDLIHRFVLLRLEQWSLLSGRVDPESKILTIYPDGVSRMILLGRLNEVMKDSTLPRDRALDVLEDHIKLQHPTGSRALAEQALNFFAHSGLVSLRWTNVQIPLVTIGQYLTGLMFALRVEMGERPEPELNKWRAVSFAAAELRRRNTIRECQDWLTRAVDGLLAESIVPGAALVVAESSDEYLAQHFLKELANLGERPLWLFDEDRGESAVGIAVALTTAGKSGFNWFYAQYMDPKYPVLHQGGAVISKIFLHMCLRVSGKLDVDQKTQLDELRKAFSGVGGVSELNVFPPLVFVIPELLEKDKAVRQLVSYLGNPAVELTAKACLVEYIANDRECVIEACEVTAVEGYESAMAAAELWMELNPSKIHTGVFDAVLAARKRFEPGNLRWIRALSVIEERLGKERYIRYLRWSLIFGGNCALGAAFALRNLGEQSVRSIGDALLHGLHGGINCEGSEQLLNSMFEAEGPSVLDWLVYRFESERWGLLSAHAGWWRLLLRLIDRYEDRGVEAFATCMKTARGFMLPRSPGLRASIGRLLVERDEAYLQIVNLALHSADLDERQAAAMLLVSCIPIPPTDALMELLRAFDGLSLRNPWEWEGFLMGLDLPPAVKKELEENAMHLLPKGKAVARLLTRSKRDTNTTQGQDDEQLVLHVLNGDLTMMDPHGVKYGLMCSDTALRVCTEQLENSTPLAASAAENLIRYHSTVIGLELRAHAATVSSIYGGHWRFVRMGTELKRAQGSADYSLALSKAVERHTAGNSEVPLLRLLMDGHREQEWMPVLANLFGFSRKDHFSMEDPGLLLLRGDLSAAVQAAVGKAASLLLQRADEEGQTPGDGSLWLALLADEHSGEKSHGGLRYLRSTKGGFCSAFPALRARVDEEHTCSTQNEVKPPRIECQVLGPGMPMPECEDTVATLQRAISPDGPFEATVIQGLLDFVLRSPPEAETEPNLRHTNVTPVRWALVQGVLDWVEGAEPNIEVIDSGFPDLHGNYVRNSDKTFDLLNLWWWRAHHDAVLFDPQLKKSLLNVLRSRIARGSSDPAANAALLLALGGTLSDDEVKPAIEATLEPSRHHIMLIRYLVLWIAERLSPSQIPTAKQAIDCVIGQLDTDFEMGFAFRQGLASLALPLAAWTLGTGETEQANRVFVRGIGLLAADMHEISMQLSFLAPLINKVDSNYVRAALEYGASAGPEQARALCLFFYSGFTGGSLCTPVGKTLVDGNG